MFKGSGAATQKVAKWTTFAVILTLLSFVAPSAWLPQQAKAVTGCVLGSSASCPANSARQIIQVTGTTTNGLYWINIGGTATQVYCIMDPRVDGGGWMLAMKGANGGNDFYYESNNWTSSTTVNASNTPGPLTRSETGVTTRNEDAKYSVFNSYPADQVLALFPSVSTNNVGGKFPSLDSTYGFSWEENYTNNAAPQWLNSTSNPSGDYCPAAGTYGVTLLSLFSNGWRCRLRVVSNSSNVSSGNPSGEASASYYSEVGNNIFSTQTYIGFFGFNYDEFNYNSGSTGGSPNIDHKVRFGFGWNENGANDESSNDVMGGIGITSVLTSNQGFSTARQAGDYYGCCSTQTGVNTSMSFEMYVRGNGDPEVTTGLPSAQTPTSATLNGTAQPGGATSTFGFCLSSTSVTDSTGKLTGCTSVAATPSSSNSATSVSVSSASPVTGLTTYANYYYQLIETNTSTNAVQVGAVQGLSPGSIMDLQGVNFTTSSSGTSWSDSSANLANPTSFGTATAAISSTSLNSVTFTGSQEFVSPTQYTPVKSGASGTSFTSFTLDTWFKATSGTYGKIIGFESGTGQTGSGSWDRMLFVDSSGYLEFGVWNSTAGSAVVTKSLATVTDGVWRHAVGTYDGNNLILYINGVQQQTSVLAATNTQIYTGYWRLGGWRCSNWATTPGDGYFTGSIARAVVYNAALTWAQVLSHYNAGLGLFGTPDAPGGLSPIAGAATGETVTWTAPNTNGSPITAYEVDTSIDNTGTSNWQVQSNSYSSSTLSVTLSSATSGINNGYIYVRVRAQNANGWGPYSTAMLQSTITYQGNNNTSGSPPSSQNVNAGSAVTLGTNTGTLARTNYSFAGWYSNSAGSGGSYYAAGSSITPTGSMTLYALWAPPIAISGNSTYNAFVGVASRSDTHTVTGGVLAAVSTPATDTFASSGAGITIDSSTANSFAFVVPNTLTAGSYYETVTATDSKGYAATQYTTIVVASAIKFPSTTMSTALTYGKSGSVVIAIQSGTGSGSKQISRATPTTTEGNNSTWSYSAGATSGTLTFTSTLPVGTYTETFTASDSSSYTSTMVLTITVNPAITFAYPSSTTVSTTTSYATTAGIGGSVGVIYGQNGTGLITLNHVVSPAAAGITLNTTTPGQASILIATTVPAANYVDAITATDSNSATSTYITNIAVNAAVNEVATSSTVTLTQGQNYVDTVTASGGTGSLTFTLTPNTYTGITLSSSGSAAYLNIAGTAPTGTFIETVTATDTLGATKSIAISVTVNAPLTISGSPSNSISTTVTKSATLSIISTGGTGTVTIATSGTCATAPYSSYFTYAGGVLTVSGSTPVNTYQCTITATDSALPTHSVVTTTISIVVNRWPLIASQAQVSSGLVFNLDAANSSSYPGSGSTWTNIGSYGTAANATFTNSNYSYTSDSAGTISFTNTAASQSNSSQSMAYVNQNVIPSLSTYTLSAWFKPTAYPTATNPVPAIVGECYVNSTVTTPTAYCGSKINMAIYLNYLSTSSAYIEAGYYDGGAWHWGDSSQSKCLVTLNTWYNVVLQVKVSGSNYTPFMTVNNGQCLPTASASSATAPVASSGTGFTSGQYYIGRRWDAADYFVGNIANISIYNRVLSTAELTQNYNWGLTRFVNNVASYSGSIATASTSTPTTGSATPLVTNSESLATTATDSTYGGTTSFQTTAGVSATLFDSGNLGTTGLSYVLTGSPGPTLTSGTGTSFSLNYPSTLAAGTYTNTVTGTDSTTATTATSYSVTVNPSITISTGSASPIGTSGVALTDTITASQGTGTKTFSISPAITGITLSSTGTNTTSITTTTTLAAGTYNENVTATDGVGATTTQSYTIKINPAPTISGPSTVSMTTGYAFSTPYFTPSNGTGTLTPSFTGTLSTTYISLDATNAPLFRLLVTSAAPTGTYTETLKIQDSLGASSTLVLTLTVNGPLTVSGTNTITTTFGTSQTVAYQTSGGTAPLNILGTNACAPVETISGSYTIDKFVGIGTCTWTTPQGISSIDVLTVGGGGSGGSRAGGGGGAGGYLYNPGVSTSSGATHSITVGLGGAPTIGSSNNGTTGNNGSPSKFDSYVGSGGGYGAASANYNGNSGGSGGGGFGTGSGGAGTTGQGNAGGSPTSSGSGGGDYSWSGGGGGGSASAGSNATLNGSYQAAGGNGGSGTPNSITGTAICYAAGGGGGASYNSLSAGAGGTCSGLTQTGSAGSLGNVSATAGTDETGSGGGGSGFNGPSESWSGRGGSGVVIVRYATPQTPTNTAIKYTTGNYLSSPASFLVSVPESVTVGTYSETIAITQSSDGSSEGTGAVTNYTVNVTVNKATPTVSIALPGAATSVSYGFATTISASTNAPGSVTFYLGSISTPLSGCSNIHTVSNVATCIWKPSALGAVTIGATLVTPDDTTDYTSTGNGTLSASVTAAATLTISGAAQTLTYTGSPLGSGTFTATSLASIDSLTAVTLTYSGTANDGTTYTASTTKPIKAGTYTVTPSNAVGSSAIGTSNYSATFLPGNYSSVAYSPGTLTILRAAISGAISYGDTNTATITYNSTVGYYAPIFTFSYDPGTTMSFSSDNTNVCSVNLSTGYLTAASAGTCTVTLSISQGNNYQAATLTRLITVNRAARVFTLTSSASLMKYGDTATITSVITPSDTYAQTEGVVSYSLAPTSACSLNSSTMVLTALAATGSCVITGSITQGDHYLAVTSAAPSITFHTAVGPTITYATVTTVNYTGSAATFSLTPIITGLKLSDALNTVNAIYSGTGSTNYGPSTTPPTHGGSYLITPSAWSLSTGSISNYDTPTYTAVSATIAPINQTALSDTQTMSAASTPFQLAYLGGSTGGTATYQISGGTASGCTINSNGILNALSQGTCIVLITLPATTDYNAVTLTITVTVAQYVNYAAQVVVSSGGPQIGGGVANQGIVSSGPAACSSACAPTITSFQSNTGATITSALSNDFVTIIGSGFTGATLVRFGRGAITSIVVNSDTSVTFQVPNGTPIGSVQIKVQAPGGLSAGVALNITG